MAETEQAPQTKLPEVKPDRSRHEAWEEQDREVARISETVQPGSAAPSRAGITGPGSGADSERMVNKP
jgi:hypothetical protein